MIHPESAIRLRAPMRSVTGKVILPSSKSISNRLLIINALACSPFKVNNLSESDDTRVMESILQSNDPVFDVGHAGTAMRFLTAYLSRIAGEWVLTGSERMKQRPIGILVDALRKLGAHIKYTPQEGFPPLKIKGSHLHGGTLELDGSVSSQYITALLLIAPELDGGLILRLQNRITSRSYIGMTLKLMEQAGVRSSVTNNEIRVPRQPYLARAFTVEADWSAASYWYEMLALCESGRIELENLRVSGLQGDEAVARWFSSFGIETQTTESGVLIEKTNGGQPDRMVMGFHDNPDMGQTLAALCVAKGIPFHFTGLETLRIKETDRIAALVNELAQFGAEISIPAPGELRWDGKINQAAIRAEPVIETYNDHRMALAFAPLALTGRPVIIRNPGVVTKSYPHFWEDLRSVGFLTEKV